MTSTQQQAETDLIRLAANVDTQSVEGHDRDCARAIWSQANNGHRLDTIQVEHLLSIGTRSGREAVLYDIQRNIQSVLDDADCPEHVKAGLVMARLMVEARTFGAALRRDQVIRPGASDV